MGLVAAAAAACDGGKLDLEAVPDATVTSPEDPVAIMVTATNVGTERITWGRGSSSCQLSLVVRVDGSYRRAIEDRDCTSNLAEQGLDPGESRTEVLSWPGWIRENGVLVLLPEGSYPVRAAAGDIAFTTAGSITVESAPPTQQ